MPAKKQVTGNRQQATVKKAPAAKKAVVKAEVKTTTTGLTVPAYSLAGVASTMSLPKEVFAKKTDEKSSDRLLSQAVRVYITNQKIQPGSTKTRGEVQGSTAKIFRQKGTGRARHGSVRAPIFVGGGIVFGPTPRKTRLSLPKKMKRAALLAAISAKLSQKEIVGVTGLEKASGKTKEMVKLMGKIGKNILIITDEKQDNVVRGVKNIQGIDVIQVNLVNALDVVKHQMLVVTKEAMEKLAAPKKESV